MWVFSCKDHCQQTQKWNRCGDKTHNTKKLSRGDGRVFQTSDDSGPLQCRSLDSALFDHPSVQLTQCKHSTKEGSVTLDKKEDGGEGFEQEGLGVIMWTTPPVNLTPYHVNFPL